jgi:hypothetical protein
MKIGFAAVFRAKIVGIDETFSVGYKGKFAL